MDRGGYNPSMPSFCHACGKAYPWTEERLSAAQALVAEAEELTASEQDQLSKSLEAVMHDTPSTNLGAARIRKFVAKVKGPIGDAIYKAAIDLATETAVKLLKGS